jgi:nicotinamide-nucleotide adenylyltransferase
MVQFSAETLEQMRLIQRLLATLDPQGPPEALVLPPSPSPQGPIIVFPAAFNPPTIAHLALLRQAQEFARSQTSGDTAQDAEQEPRVYAAVSKQIIDKEGVQRPLLLDRLFLLREVIARHLAGVGIMLFNRGLYVEQAEAVRRCFPAVTRLTFLVGFDKILQIFDARYYRDRDQALRELFQLADLLVAPRGEGGEQEVRSLLARPENRPFASAVRILPFDPAYRAISSTRVRQQPQAHAQDVPPEVWRFIVETHAYDAPPAEGEAADPYGERMRMLAALLRDPGSDAE